MAHAVPLLDEKVIDESRGILELVIWRVARTARFPDGVRYRLAHIEAGKSVPSVLYDNHAPKGHHRHFLGTEERYDFTDADRLVADFKADITALKKEGEEE